MPDSDLEVFYGQPHKGLTGIHKSYKEVRKKVLPEDAFEREAYYYPLDQEIKIINYMKTNNFDAADKVFLGIVRENLKRNPTQEETIKVTTLIFEMLYRYACDLDINLKKAKAQFEKLQESEKQEVLWDYIHSIMDHIAQSYNQNQNMNVLGRDIVGYVKEHYHNAELSQQDIADLFHISRPTVSKIFKETARVNFIDYLHNLRIEQAKKLFDAGETDILGVAQKTGYDNEITFKRAFRKNEAITPREYVRMIKSKRK
jgi:YesN/AraC family two-component response regulator